MLPFKWNLFCRVHTESWILEKVLKFVQQFFRPRKILENRDEVCENWVFFPKLQQMLYKWIFFHFCQILFNLVHMFAAHREKSFVPALWNRWSIESLTTLESGIKNFFWKRSGKVLNFGSKNLCEPCIYFLGFYQKKFELFECTFSLATNRNKRVNKLKSRNPYKYRLTSRCHSWPYTVLTLMIIIQLIFTFDMTNGLRVWTIYKVIHIALLLFVHCNKNN